MCTATINIVMVCIKYDGVSACFIVQRQQYANGKGQLFLDVEWF